MSTLPDELLALIFIAGHIQSRLYAPPFALFCSHVSRKWRAIALQTSSLWTTIVLQLSLHPSFLDLLLTRSHTSPLDLYIDLRPHTPTLPLARGLMKMRVFKKLYQILPFVARWRTLSVFTDADQDTLDFLCYIMHLRAPLLSRLEILVERHTRSEFPRTAVTHLFSQGAGSLSSISLEGLGLRAAYPPLANVKDLALDLSCTSMTCADFVRALGEMQVLTSLRIVNYNFDLPPLGEGSGDEPRVRFQSATLQHLSIVSLLSDEDYISRFWSILQFPSLLSITLTCNNAEDIPVFARYAAFPMLRALRLTNAENLDDASSLAAALPLLEDLSLQWCNPERLLRTLLHAEPTSSSKDWDWPHLCTLSLSDVGGDVLQLLQEIIAKRKETGSPLTKLRFGGSGVDELGGCGEGMREVEKLRQIVDVEVFD